MSVCCVLSLTGIKAHKASRRTITLPEMDPPEFIISSLFTAHREGGFFDLWPLRTHLHQQTGNRSLQSFSVCPGTCTARGYKSKHYSSPTSPLSCPLTLPIPNQIPEQRRKQTKWMTLFKSYPQNHLLTPPQASQHMEFLYGNLNCSS